MYEIYDAMHEMLNYHLYDERFNRKINSPTRSFEHWHSRMMMAGSELHTKKWETFFLSFHFEINILLS
jgi:hypothetical protein